MTSELRRYGARIVGVTRGEYTQVKVLDPGELYDIPLLVAYHCQLYVTPADIG